MNISVSHHIAALLGPVLAVLSLSEYLNLRIWKEVHASVVYLNGLFLFAAGIAITHFHQYWVPDWPVVITVMGWLILLFGGTRMFFPLAKQNTNKSVTNGVLVLLFLTGVFLTYKGYF